METYIFKNGKRRDVKNLGWLRAHRNEVQTIALTDRTDGARCGCAVKALLEDGTIYRTTFNSVSICREWFKRHKFPNAAIFDTVTAKH